MKWRVAFREWTPDLPPVVNPGLITAKNVLPGAAGYMPVPSLISAGQAALPERPRGAISGLDSAADSFHIVGTSTNLYRMSLSGTADVSRSVGGPYNCTGQAQWNFIQRGDTIIAVNPNDDIQILDLASGLFSRLSIDAPRARYIGYVGPQIVVGNLTSDPVIGGAGIDAIRSPSIDDPAVWPDPTDPGSGAVALQAYLATLPGNGGRIQAIVSGSEVSAIFQEQQIVRIEYVGGDVIFQLDPVARSKGLIAPRAAVGFERAILYLAEDGWRTFDYTKTYPIGDQKVNRTFLADFDQSYPDRVSAILHPDLPIVAVAYPGAGNFGGRPNRLLFYNHAIDRWARAEIDLELLCRFLPFNQTLDSLLGNLDTDYPTSFDELVSGFGSGVMSAYDSAFLLSTFGGPSLAARLETGDQEHLPGRIARVSAVRPLVDGTEPTVSVSSRMDRRTAESAITFGSPASLNRSGECPVRGAKGRYHRYRVDIPAGWTDHAVGLDVSGSQSGTR